MPTSKPRHGDPVVEVVDDESGNKVIVPTRQFQQFLDELDQNVALTISLSSEESNINSAYLAKLQNQIGSGDFLTCDDTGFTCDSTKFTCDQDEA